MGRGHRKQVGLGVDVALESGRWHFGTGKVRKRVRAVEESQESDLMSFVTYHVVFHTWSYVMWCFT